MQRLAHGNQGESIDERTGVRLTWSLGSTGTIDSIVVFPNTRDDSRLNEWLRSISSEGLPRLATGCTGDCVVCDSDSNGLRKELANEKTKTSWAGIGKLECV
jgi:hypothetical protein